MKGWSLGAPGFLLVGADEAAGEWVDAGLPDLRVRAGVSVLSQPGMEGDACEIPAARDN